MRAVDLIAKKRRGMTHAAEEVAWLLGEYAADRIPDYQMAAWLMAVCFQGLDRSELSALTEAMVQSGEALDLSRIAPEVADKHSTGGVGDKVSVVLGPVVAACGLPFAKMSGRGLGHTGGTVDKLESIPGYRTELSVPELMRVVERAGVAIIGQTPGLVPADKRLYALRDVTATVDQEALIAASVMSKKIAGGATCIVLDIKVGEGAFMPDEASARRLGDLMIGLGTAAGRRVACIVSRMEAPLGRAVGNALEIREAMEVLAGRGPEDVREVTVTLASRLLVLAGVVDTMEGGRARAGAALDSGAAQSVARVWIEAQGGDPAVVEGLALPSAPVVRPVRASAGGVVQAIHARVIADACVLLGAGRPTKDAAVDHAVGVVLRVGCGDTVEAGDMLAEVHARSGSSAAVAESAVRRAVELGSGPGGRRTPIVLAEL